MEFSQDDFDHLLMFEHARKSAEATHAKDPLDADVSTIYSLHDLLFRLISSQFLFFPVNPAIFLFIELSFT